MKAKDIRELSVVEIEKNIREQRDALVGLRVRKQIGQVENTAELKSLRREIARLETLLGEKKRAEALSA